MAYNVLFALRDKDRNFLFTCHSSLDVEPLWRANKWRQYPSRSIAKAGFEGIEYGGEPKVKKVCKVVYDNSSRHGEGEARHLQRVLSEILRPFRLDKETFHISISDEEVANLFEFAYSVLDAKDDVKLHLDFQNARAAKLKELCKGHLYEKKEGYIYLMDCGNAYKIGYSDSPIRRSLEVSIHMGKSVNVIAERKVPDMRYWEAVLHIICSNKHLADNYNKSEDEDFKSHCSELYKKDPEVLNKFEAFMKLNIGEMNPNK